MKKTITLLALLTFGISKSQTVADFESFSLPADSFYYNATGMDWQTTNASFQYGWNTSFGGYWSDGFAYTNKQNVDSGNYRHLYNCIAGKGYNLSNYYSTGQPGGFIRVKAPSTGVNGFYVTNTTYAYKAMKNGDAFAKKFGGLSGNDPDWFKLTVKGYSGGNLKTDSVEFYLADFRFNNNSLDYILNSWQWVDCNKLGAVDSVTFFLFSSDVGSFGINTPAFFSIDNFTTGQGVGIAEVSSLQSQNLFPNPANDVVNINFGSEQDATITIFNSIGEFIKQEKVNGTKIYPVDLRNLSSGLYFIEIITDNNLPAGKAGKQNYKLIKN
jgi:hypothetical protein